MIADDLSKAQITTSFMGLVYAAGLLEGYCCFEWSDDSGATRGDFADGSTRRLVSPDPVADEQPAITELPSGAILVAVTQEGQVRVYQSHDFGWSWEVAGAVG